MSVCVSVSPVDLILDHAAGQVVERLEAFVLVGYLLFCITTHFFNSLETLLVKLSV